MLLENHWAIKEWAVVCAALAAGRQSLLLRTGGIAEGPRGFTVEHPEFWLLPTRFHQSTDELRPDAADWIAATTTPMPGKLLIELYAIVTDVRFVEREADLAAWESQQILSAATVRERFRYRRPGLYVLLLEVQRLAAPVIIDDLPQYAGCHSWVPLDRALPTTGLAPVPQWRASSRAAGAE